MSVPSKPSQTSILKIDDKIFNPQTYVSESNSIILDKVFELFSWIYLPKPLHNFANIKELMDYALLIGIPLSVINIKVYEFNNDIHNNKTLTTSEINSIHDFVNKFKSSSVFFKKQDIINSLEDEKNKHKFYPLPNPNLGRPNLYWYYCAHYGCKKSFNTPSDLVNHLVKMHSYKRGYHLAHEQRINALKNFTPQYILKSKLTMCPSFHCDKVFNTPEDLIKHLTVLGIKGFYNGQNEEDLIYELSDGKILIGNKEEKTNEVTCEFSTKTHQLISVENFDIYKDNNVYTNEECAVCYDNEPQVIFIPCMHHLVCFTCSLKCSKVCVMCRKPIEQLIPF